MLTLTDNGIDQPANATQSGDGDCEIYLMVSNPCESDYPLAPGRILYLALEKAITDAGINASSVFAAGDFMRIFGGLCVTRSSVLPAIAAIRAMLEIGKLMPRSAIFWRDRDEGMFRTAHFGRGLGAPITLTSAQFIEWLDEARRKLVAQMESKNVTQTPPPPDAGENPS